MQVALAAEGLWRALLRAGSGRTWAPWLALGALQAAVLLVLPRFAHPLLSPVLLPFVRGTSGEGALHYPAFYAALPAVYARADLVVTAVAGALAAGWSASLFAATWRGRGPDPGAAWAEAAPRALALVVGLLPLWLLAGFFATAVPQAVASQGGLVRRAAAVASLGGTALAQALFLFVPALAVLEGRGVAGTFAALPRAWARGFWAALLLGAALALAGLPFARLDRVAGLLVDRHRPEWVTALVGAALVARLVLSFLFSGAATLVYLGAVAGQAREGDA